MTKSYKQSESLAFWGGILFDKIILLNYLTYPKSISNCQPPYMYSF